MARQTGFLIQRYKTYLQVRDAGYIYFGTDKDANLYADGTGARFTGTLTFNGHLNFTGAPTGHVIDFTGVTHPANKQLIRAGSYGSPMPLSAVSDGLLWLYATSDFEDGFDTLSLFCITESKNSGCVAISAAADSIATGDSYPRALEAGQFITLLRAGAKLGAIVGATDGMYAGWFKVGATVTSVADVGCRVAPLWIDNQMNCTVGGEEYAAFLTTGGSVPDGVFGFETTSGGWNNFLVFDETTYNKVPIVSADITGSTKKYLKVDLNGTAYGIHLWSVA